LSTTIISGEQLYKYFVGGFQNLQNNEKKIDSLNVFPVPDGDTGSNMVMTLSGGVTAAADIESAEQMMRTFSRGTLFSARGNSGVILSQFIRGFSKGVEGLGALTPEDFAKAMQCGVEYAYKAVITPVEGTVLTVMRETSEHINQNIDKIQDFTDLFNEVIPRMKFSLERTPEKLEVLKEAGVVDSGAAGLLCIFEGMQAVAEGKSIDNIIAMTSKSEVTLGRLDRNTRLEYGYCTEFILQLMEYKTDIPSFKLQVLIDFLESVGDSVVAVIDDDVVKVHVHTFEPEKVLAFAHQFGEFVTMKIENMTVQHSEVSADTEEPNVKEHKKFAIVATASGDGIAEYFKDIGADVIVQGGQTNNPSAEDFIDAFEKLDAEHIIVLPNNGNIIMAASLAADLYKQADVKVIETHSVAEGYSVLSMMDPSVDTVEEFIETMSAGLSNVVTGYVTTATRDVTMNGVTVEKGKYIGLDRDNILCCTDNKVSAVEKMLKALPDINQKETVILFCGEDVTEEEKSELEAILLRDFPLFDIGFIDGGQPVYSFILSIE